MDVRFSRSPHGGSVALIDRSDGLTLRMWSYDRKHSVPHDLAHFVAERAFVLPQGVWGSIAAGAVFRSMEVVSGRCRHDSHARSAAVIAENAGHIGLAEIVAGVVHRGLTSTEQERSANCAGAGERCVKAHARCRFRCCTTRWQSSGS